MGILIVTVVPLALVVIFVPPAISKTSEFKSILYVVLDEQLTAFANFVTLPS